MYDYNNITCTLEKVYNIKPGVIIQTSGRFIKYLEITPIGLYGTSDPIRNQELTFMVLRLSKMCEDWRMNIEHLFPEIKLTNQYYWNPPKWKKEKIGDRYTPLTPCAEIILNEKIYYVDMVDFFLEVLGGHFKTI